MTTFDNQPPLDDWAPQPGKHCGQLCLDVSCPVCGELVPRLGPNIVLSDN